MNLNKENIKQFLDSVDHVLNSNTFLLSLKVDYNCPEKTIEQLTEFIDSGNFQKQILEQDVIRNWNNYQYLNPESLLFEASSKELIKPNYNIELKEIEKEKKIDYLVLMLIVEPNKYNFWSPYGRQYDKSTAKNILSTFLDEIVESRRWRLFTLNTDFCYSQVDDYNDEEIMSYFQGDYGSDSASLIIAENDDGFLLLTNGVD